jgi:hypothetical protein
MIKSSTTLSEDVMDEAKEALRTLKIIAVKPYLTN